MKKNLLIIDDKVNLCRSLVYNFRRFDYRCSYALDRSSALLQFGQQDFDAVILDIRLGEENGIEVLRRLLEAKQGIPVIMLTGYATIPDAVESIKRGAYDYLQKPANFQQLLNLVECAVAERGGRNDQGGTRRHSGRSGDEPWQVCGDPGARLITKSPGMTTLCTRARKLANSNLPVLLCGESGTGKELLAELIHASSARRDCKMVKINCAAFPESLLDNELFGHEKGAFTGADSDYPGVFEQAHRSTLFLDEVSDMSAAIQARILRAIQNQEIRRIGGKSVVHIDVRFIGATNRDIRKMVTTGAFREDLFYRLSAASLEIPPLRQRREDIPVLCDHFLQEFAGEGPRRGGETGRKTLSCGVLDAFLRYDWPGNIRELRNLMHYTSTVATQTVIQMDDLPPDFAGRKGEADLLDVQGRIERQRIEMTLQHANYNKKQAAEMLRISRKTLYSKIEKYGIATPG